MSGDEALFDRVAAILEAARTRVARSINTAMVQTYWQVGREIVEVEQGGEARAPYGDEVLAALSRRLTARYGRGWSLVTLRRARQFFLVFPVGSEIRSSLMTESRGEAPFPPDLSWTHYQVLMRISNPTARTYYEIEAAREHWSVRELERQISSLTFERLARATALPATRPETVSARDVIKDPLVLEFLDLPDALPRHERELEQAIVDRLEQFLRELGKGFCFVARQRRITLDGDHFYVDLVLYNRLLRCFVLLDLKLGKLTHQDLGQMQMYVNYFDRFERDTHEARTIGIVLCSEKNDAMVRITLPADDPQIVAARYQLYLPTEEELREALTRERDRAERALRLRSDVCDETVTE